MTEPHGTRDRIQLWGGGALVLGILACTGRTATPTPPPVVVTAPAEGSPPSAFRRQTDSSAPPPITCETAAGHRRVLTLDWTPAEREAVSKGLSRGLAVVRLVGCHLEFLPECRVPAGRHVYTVRPPFHYSLTIEPELPVWIANLPRWASERSPRPPSRLHVDIIPAGQYRAAPIDLRRAARVGECDGATHVISTIEVGAIYEESSPLATDCHLVHHSDTEPPPHCAMPWSVQLTALDPHAPLGQPCPAPLHWNTLYCGSDRELPPSQTCGLAPPGYPPCAHGWGLPPPDDPQRRLFPERLDPQMIDAGLDTVRDAIARCGARTGQPKGSRVQLRLRVDGPTGQVLAARALGAQASAPLGRCAVQGVADARFPTTFASDQTITTTISTH